MFQNLLRYLKILHKRLKVFIDLINYLFFWKFDVNVVHVTRNFSFEGTEIF